MLCYVILQDSDPSVPDIKSLPDYSYLRLHRNFKRDCAKTSFAFSSAGPSHRWAAGQLFPRVWTDKREGAHRWGQLRGLWDLSLLVHGGEKTVFCSLIMVRRVRADGFTASLAIPCRLTGLISEDAFKARFVMGVAGLWQLTCHPVPPRLPFSHGQILLQRHSRYAYPVEAKTKVFVHFKAATLVQSC